MKVPVRLIDCPLRSVVSTHILKSFQGLSNWPSDKLECGHSVARKIAYTADGDAVPIPAKKHRCRACGIDALPKNVFAARLEQQRRGKL